MWSVRQVSSHMRLRTLQWKVVACMNMGLKVLSSLGSDWRRDTPDPSPLPSPLFQNAVLGWCFTVCHSEDVARRAVGYVSLSPQPISPCTVRL